MTYEPSGKHTVDGQPWRNPKVEERPKPKPRKSKDTEPAEAATAEE